MTSNSLMHLIIERLREIPQNQHYEMVGSYGLVKDFLETLQLHGIKVLNFHSVWYVGNHGSKNFFPIRVRSNLPPGTFILQPKRGGEEMGKKKRAKKPKTPPGGGY